MKKPPPLHDLLGVVSSEVQQDLRCPLPLPVAVRRGDARDLADWEDGSIGGIVTSPPYLSRYDYERIAKPLEEVHRYWYPAEPSPPAQPSAQVAAYARAPVKPRGQMPLPKAVEEVCGGLEAEGQPRLASVVTAYFTDLSRVVAECARVLQRGAPWWCVIGGARLKGVYVPSDLILAQIARGCGVKVQEIRVARNLIEPGKKLGTIARVAPRESIVVMVKA